MAEENRMNIIQIGVYPQNPNLIKGGVEASVYGLTAELGKRKNFKLKVITFPSKLIKNDYREVNGNIEVVFIRNTLKYQILSVFRFLKIIKEVEKMIPEVVHLHGTNPIILFLILYFKLKKTNFTTTVYGILSVEEYQTFKRKKAIVPFLKYLIYSVFEVYVIRLSPKIIVGTPYVKQWILKKKTLANKKIHIIPQGIDSKYYECPDNYKKQALLSVGAITERKGYEYAVKSIKLLVKKHPLLQYYILGFSDNITNLKKLKELIEHLGLQKNVYILKNTETAVIDAYLSEANIFLLHSEEESQGIVLSEAMAAGKPVVATDVGGIPYIIKNGINGFLSPFKDVKQFAENIDKLLENKNLREKISEENKKEALKYDWDNIANAILSVYKSSN